jgi:hypothetical protein
MPDDETPTDTTASVAVTTDQPASPPAEASKSFTQEDVNRIVAQRLADDRARRPAPAQPAPKPAPTKAAEQPDLASELAAMKQQQADLIARLDYEKRTKGLDLDAAKSETLFKVYQANPSAFDDAVKVFGIGAPKPATPVAPQTAPEPQRAPAAAPSAPAGNALPTQNGVIDIFNLTKEQANSLGPQGMRAELEKLWKIGSQLSGAPQRPKVPGRQ